MATKKKSPEQKAPAKFSLLKALKTAEETRGARRIQLQVLEQEHALSTGILSLDLVLGGGYWGGSIVQYFGAAGSGKSSTVVTTAGEQQARGVEVGFFDHEGGTKKDYALRLGFDMESTAYYRNSNGDKTYRMMQDVMTQMDDVDFGLPQACFLIDSIPKMPTELEMTKPDKAQQLALRAAMHSKWLGRLKTLITTKNVSLIAVNQVRLNPGQKFGSPEVRPGGNAWEFDTDTLIRVSSKKPEEPFNKDEKEIDGDKLQAVTYAIYKNKSFPAGHSCEVMLRLGKGIDPASDVLEFCTLTGVYLHGGKPVFVGLEKYVDKEILKQYAGKKVGAFDYSLVDTTFKSLDHLKALIRQQKEDGTNIIRNACKAMLASGDAVRRFLDMNRGIIPGEEVPAEAANDAELDSVKPKSRKSRLKPLPEEEEEAAEDEEVLDAEAEEAQEASAEI